MHVEAARWLDGPEVVVVGVSWRSAPLTDRERLAVPGDRAGEVVRRVLACDSVLGAVVLSTCNRTEVYVHATERERAARTCRATLAGWGGMTPETFGSIAFEHHGERAVTHLLEVVSGFDAAVPRDRQIQARSGARSLPPARSAASTASSARSSSTRTRPRSGDVRAPARTSTGPTCSTSASTAPDGPSAISEDSTSSWSVPVRWADSRSTGSTARLRVR